MKLLLALCFAAAAAEAPEFPQAPPTAGAPKPYRAPARAAFQLETGLRVTLIEDPRAPLVTARLAFSGGTAHFARRVPGLVEVLAGVLTEGTARQPARAVAERADAFGGSISAAVDDDHLVLGADALADKAGDMLRLLGEVAGMPRLDPGEIDLRKANMIEELRVARSQPGWLADLAFRRHVFAGHPYAAQTDEAAIRGVNRGPLQLAARDLVRVTNARLLIVGDVRAADLQRALEHLNDVWAVRPGAPLPPVPGPREAELGRRVLLIDRPGSPQTALRIGRRAVPESHPDYFALLLANQVLGGSFAARLNADLRERKGWTYGVYSTLRARRAAGAFVVAADVRAQATKKAIARILKHLKRLRRRAVADAELAQAKNVLIGDFVRGLETQAGLAEEVLHAELHGLGDDWLDRYVERVAAVTREDVLRAARAHLDPEAMVVVAVGDGAEIARGLRRFGRPVMAVGLDGLPSKPYFD